MALKIFFSHSLFNFREDKCGTQDNQLTRVRADLSAPISKLPAHVPFTVKRVYLGTDSVTEESDKCV